MQLILSHSDYSFAATAKEITLASPFDVLTTEQILHIFNLTTRSVIYDSDRRNYPITVAAGVITHTYDNSGMADADVLQISVDDGTSGVSAGVSNNFSATVAPTVDDDSGDGYAVGSSWVDTTADKAYVCVDATVGAATWLETTVDNPEVFLVSGTPGAGVGEVGDIAIDEDTGDIYEKESVFAGTAWNPSDCSTELALSLDDLRATHDPTSWHGAVRSVLSASSGKWYWEVRFVKTDSGLSSAAGIAGTNQPLDSLLGESADAYAYYSNGTKRNNAVETSYGQEWDGNTYTIGVAWDMDAGKIWFSRNGVWQASGDPAAGTNEAFSGISGTIYAAISIYRRYTYATAKFGATAFTYPVPTGFTAGFGADTTPWTKKLAVPKSNLSASADPTTGDDSGDGYSVGSRWENTTDDREFVCLDATVAAAAWLRTTGSVIPEKTPVNAVAAQGTVTMSGTADPGTDTFVIAGDEYLWDVAMGGEFDVAIGANASEAIANLITVVNNASTPVSALAGAGYTAIITADVKGTAGNALSFTEDSWNMAIDGTGTLGGTTTGVNGTVGEANELCADATYLYHAIAENTISDANWRRMALGSVY